MQHKPYIAQFPIDVHIDIHWYTSSSVGVRGDPCMCISILGYPGRSTKILGYVWISIYISLDIHWYSSSFMTKYLQIAPRISPRVRGFWLKEPSVKIHYEKWPPFFEGVRRPNHKKSAFLWEIDTFPMPFNCFVSSHPPPTPFQFRFPPLHPIVRRARHSPACLIMAAFPSTSDLLKFKMVF